MNDLRYHEDWASLRGQRQLAGSRWVVMTSYGRETRQGHTSYYCCASLAIHCIVSKRMRVLLFAFSVSPAVRIFRTAYLQRRHAKERQGIGFVQGLSALEPLHIPHG